MAKMHLPKFIVWVLLGLSPMGALQAATIHALADAARAEVADKVKEKQEVEKVLAAAEKPAQPQPVEHEVPEVPAKATAPVDCFAIKAAQVNDKVIFCNEVYDRMNAWNMSYAKALDSLIEAQLVLQYFEKNKGKIPEAHIELEMEGIEEKNFKGDRSRLRQALSSEGKSLYGLKENIRNSIIIDVVRGQIMREGTNVAPNKIRQYYDTHLDQFKVNARYCIQHSGFKDSDSIQADDGEMTKGGYFRKLLMKKMELAKMQKLLDSFKNKPVWYDEMELDPELCKLPVGGHTQYQKSGDLWVVSTLVDKQEAYVKSYTDVYSEIERYLKQQNGQKRYRDFIERLRNDALIEIYPQPAH